MIPNNAIDFQAVCTLLKLVSQPSRSSINTIIPRESPAARYRQKSYIAPTIPLCYLYLSSATFMPSVLLVSKPHEPFLEHF